MFDGEAFGREIVAATKAHVDRVVGPLVARLAELEKRLGELPDLATQKAVDELRADMATLVELQVVTRLAALPVAKDGEKGERGEIGPIGRDGRDGVNGKDGLHGKDGVDGLPGKDGRDGDAGPRGERGEPGEKGEAGERGRDGVDGAKGEPGERGKDGVNGLDGKDGAPGRDGATGEKGLQGERGERGEKGEPGLNGKDGLDIVDVIRAGDRFLVVMSNGTTKDLGDCRGKDGVDGRDGLNGKDAEIFAPDDVVDNLMLATKMLAMRPDSIDMHGAKGISLQFPSIEIPPPQVHVSPTIVNMPQKRMRTVVKKHDTEGRIQEIEQQEID